MGFDAGFVPCEPSLKSYVLVGVVVECAYDCEDVFEGGCSVRGLTVPFVSQEIQSLDDLG